MCANGSRCEEPALKTYYSQALGRRVTIPENDQAGYEPIAVVSTPAEAAEVATSDYGRRLRLLDEERDPMFVDAYEVFVLARFDDPVGDPHPRLPGRNSA
jgi:hypothetical protein